MNSFHKSIDILLYGANGFTGKRTLKVLLEHAAKEDLRIAFAGRDPKKLEELAELIPPNRRHTVESVAVEIHQTHALTELIRRSRVVVNTAGPFVRTGPVLIPICIAEHCDYLDITGETPFVRDMILNYDDVARRNEVRIIPLCGFDSVPSDLGTYLSVKAWTERYPHEILKRITGLFQAKGGVNGGTLASVYDMLESGKITEVLSNRHLNLLHATNTPSPPVSQDWYGPRRVPGAKNWGVPFFMSPINSRVVRRTQSLMMQNEENPVFRVHFGEFIYEEGLALTAPLAFFLGPIIGLFFKAAPLLSGRKKILDALWKKLPRPGSGPSEESIRNGFFKIEHIAEGGSGTRLVTQISSAGDPGNHITVQCLVQSALCLTLENRRKKLKPRYGVITPAFALGETLRDGLEDSGFHFRIYES